MRSLVHTGDSRNIAFYSGARQATLVRADGWTMALPVDTEWSAVIFRRSASSCVTRAARSPACTGPAKIPDPALSPPRP